MAESESRRSRCHRRGHSVGATLTPRGTELVERFYKIQRGIYHTFARELVSAAHLVGGDTKGTKISPRLGRWMEVRAKLGKCVACVRQNRNAKMGIPTALVRRPIGIS